MPLTPHLPQTWNSANSRWISFTPFALVLFYMGLCHCDIALPCWLLAISVKHDSAKKERKSAIAHLWFRLQSIYENS